MAEQLQEEERFWLQGVVWQLQEPSEQAVRVCGGGRLQSERRGFFWVAVSAGRGKKAREKRVLEVREEEN